MSSHDRTTQVEPEASCCPYPLYTQLRERGVTFVEEANAFMVTRAEDVDTVLRDVETFSSRDAIGLTPIEPGSEPTEAGFYLVTTDSPEHSRRRRLAARAFTSGRRSGLHQPLGRPALAETPHHDNPQDHSPRWCCRGDRKARSEAPDPATDDTAPTAPE